MRHKEIAEALAGTMIQEGYELDAGDRILIRKTILDGLSAQRRRATQEISAASTFRWTRPHNPRLR